MFQKMVASHIHPQVQVQFLGATTSATAGTIVAFNTVPSGKAVSNVDATWQTSAQMTGSATNVSGFYFARLFEQVPGYTDMVCLCSASVQLAGLPLDAVAIPFATSADLSSGPNIASGSVPSIWYPCLVNSDGQRLSMETTFPVQNSTNLASYFGVAIFGTFGSTAKALNGAVSLRQHVKDVPIFTPVK